MSEQNVNDSLAGGVAAENVTVQNKAICFSS